MPKEKIQTLVQQQSKDNAQVNQNLQRIIQYTEQHALADLILWLKDWQGNDQLEMTNTHFKFKVVIAITLMILFFLFQLPFWIYLLPIILIIFAFVKKASNQMRNELTHTLLTQRLEEKYQLKFSRHDLTMAMEQLVEAFPLFTLGDYANQIENFAATELEIDHLCYPVTLFHYHYVDKVETKDNDGKTRTEYRHYHKYGVFVAGLAVKGISISNTQKRKCRLDYKWSTSDIHFNKKYQLSGSNEIVLAKVFSPARVLHFEQYLPPYHGDFYIHPQYDVLCWLFEQNIFEQKPDISMPRHVPELVSLIESVNMPEYERFKFHLTAILEKLH